MGRRSRRLPTAHLVCSVCGSSDLYVTESRGTAERDRITRRRKCAQCGTNRHSTELPDEPMTEAEAEEIRRFAERALASYERRKVA